MKTFRMASRGKAGGKVMAFGKVFSSLEDLLRSLQIENWKRRRHDLNEATHYAEYWNKSRRMAKALPKI